MTYWDECSQIEVDSNITDGTQSNQVWEMIFYDEGFFGDSALNIACEPNGTGGCTFIPLQYLKWGTVYWTYDPGVYDYDVQVRFLAIAE